MNRENVNKIKYVLDNVLPPVVRDGFTYDFLLKIYFKSNLKWVLEFRKRVKSMSQEIYVDHYKELPDIMGETDLNKACLHEIVNNSKIGNVLDVGSGRGYLCKIIEENTSQHSVTGVDIAISETLKSNQNIKFIEGNITHLPFDDNEFDVVICSHVLEHILEFTSAINEIKRVCKKRLIFVVPMEREYRNGFNLHVQFFPYTHSFLNRLEWDTSNAVCKILDGDIYFQQDLI